MVKDVIIGLNGKGKFVIGISIVTLLTLISTIFVIGGKYKIAEQDIKKVPTLEERVTNVEKDMAEVKTIVSFVREDTKEIKSLLRRR